MTRKNVAAAILFWVLQELINLPRTDIAQKCVGEGCGYSVLMDFTHMLGAMIQNVC